MQDRQASVVDSEGRRGVVSATAGDRVEVRLDSGEAMSLPRDLLTEEPAGELRLSRPFRTLLDGPDGRARVVPVIEEQVRVGIRQVERERVSVTTQPVTREEVIDLPLAHQEIAVKRVPVGRVVEAIEGPRQEGATLVVPVYEEVLVVHKQLVLREEVHITLERHERREQRRVELRRDEVRIERLPPREEHRG